MLHHSLSSSPLGFIARNFKEMAYSPGDLSSLLLNGSNESSRMNTLGGAMALFRTEGGGSAQKVLLEEVYGLGLEC